MSVRKLLLVGALALAVVIALFQTVSLFTGMHTWYTLDNGIPCGKCHGDIYEAFSGAHQVMGDGNWNKACAACHRVNLTGYTYASGEDGSAPGKEAHAATTLSCDLCHFNSSNPVNAPIAGGFGLSDLSSGDTGVNASHYSFVNDSAAFGILWSSSESCAACHTPMMVQINFNVSTEATIIANNTPSSATSSFWVVETIDVSDYKTYTEVK